VETMSLHPFDTLLESLTHGLIEGYLIKENL
jgi:hypothetical protein